MYIKFIKEIIHNDLIKDMQFRKITNIKCRNKSEENTTTVNKNK